MDQTITPHSKHANALLGALVGDAVGALLELTKHITPADVHRAFTLPGGTIRNLAQG